MAGNVGPTMPIQTGDPATPGFGHGFTVQDDHGRFCMAVAYATAAEADAAAEKIREALASATWARCQRT